MSYVAVATRDGETVNAHFGKTPFFYIYEVGKEKIKLIERRNVVEIRQQMFSHNETVMKKITELLNDCKSVVAEQIGIGAARSLIESGIRVYEAQGGIDAVLNKLPVEDNDAGQDKLPFEDRDEGCAKCSAKKSCQKSNIAEGNIGERCWG